MAAIPHGTFDLTVQALLPRFKMEGNEDYDPADDWESDSKGKPHMDYPDFFDALFELADGGIASRCRMPGGLHRTWPNYRYIPPLHNS